MSQNSPIALEQTLIPWIGKTMKHIDMLIAKEMRLAGLDLTKNQFILLKLTSHGPKPQQELAMITERDKGSLTRLIQSVEKKGLISRVAHAEDKRVNQVHITPLGVAALEEAKPVIQTIFNHLQKGIASSEREVARSVLQRVMQNAIHQLDHTS